MQVVLLSLFLGVLGYVTVVLLLMELGMREVGGYDYYIDKPVGVALAIGGAAVGLAAPWIVQRLTRNRS